MGIHELFLKTQRSPPIPLVEASVYYHHASLDNIVNVVDFGAKICIISSDFINDSMTPVRHQKLFGISHVPILAPVYEDT